MNGKIGKMNSKLEFKGNKAFFAFIIQFVFRLILEVYSLPYTIGYDTVVSLIPGVSSHFSTLGNLLINIGPVYYSIAILIQNLLQDPTLTIKILAVSLQGLFGLSMFLWGTTFLNRKNALFFSLITSFYFSTLRISWDLQRNVLGLCFLFLCMYAFESIQNKKIGSIILPLFSILAITADPLILPILVVVLLPRIAKKDKIATFSVFISLIFFWAGLYTLTGNNAGIIDTLLNELTLFIPNYLYIFPQGFIALEFFLYLTLPLIPFLFKAIISISKDKVGISKLMPAILWFSASIILSLILGLGYRFAFMAPIPAIAIIIYYINDKHKTQRKMIIGITIIFAIGFCAFQNPYPFPYYTTPVMWRSEFLSAFPSSMLQNTIPLADSGKVNDLFIKADQMIASSNSTSIIIVNDPMLYFSITSHSNNTYYYGSHFDDPKPAINNYLAKGYNVYIIWWQSGKQWYNIDFAQILRGYNYSVVATKGDYAIYYVSPS
jgi:hypothetical protein